MNSLVNISYAYDTDKNPNGHNYVSIYDKYFSEIRENAKNVLEIGVWKGESLKMWQSYFPNALIRGMDIHENSINFKENNSNANIEVLIGSQSDPKFLEQLKDRKYDVIIDDGSHLASDQFISFISLFDQVAPGGYYVIEDIHTAYWPGWGGKDFIDFCKEKIDELNFHGRYRENGNRCGNPEFVLENLRDYSEYEESIESIHFHTSLVIFKFRK